MTTKTAEDVVNAGMQKPGMVNALVFKLATATREFFLENGIDPASLEALGMGALAGLMNGGGCVAYHTEQAPLPAAECALAAAEYLGWYDEDGNPEHGPQVGESLPAYRRERARFSAQMQVEDIARNPEPREPSRVLRLNGGGV